MKIRSLLLYLFSAPADLVGVILSFLLGGLQYRSERLPNCVGVWALTAEVTWLPGRYAATTISPHVILYRDRKRPPVGEWSKRQRHEHRHVEQYESACLIGIVLALGAVLGGLSPFGGLVVWVVLPWLYMGAGYAVAWLRGEDPYFGSHNEEDARAIAAKDDD